MSLQISTLSHQPWTQTDPTRCSITGVRSLRRVELGWSNSKGSYCNGVFVEGKNVKVKCVGRVSLEESVEVKHEESENSKLVGKVTEVNKDTFWPIVHSAQDKVVVLDMFTQWCGPCKVMAPKYEKLAQEKLDVIFLKLDCNQENKALAKELGIRVVPTFKILKDSKIVKEVTGAKFDELVEAINKSCAGSD
ncbi:hypothetical protein RND81_09G249600 [Saponaria officinalis]|uniref:Thioredoxin domain-containing protein n=1 Tax=Saponaria officinalis TaxID=3572 RepID=A0AAW1IRD3_SAPOF